MSCRRLLQLVMYELVTSGEGLSVLHLLRNREEQNVNTWRDLIFLSEINARVPEGFRFG